MNLGEMYSDLDQNTCSAPRGDTTRHSSPPNPAMAFPVFKNPTGLMILVGGLEQCLFSIIYGIIIPIEPLTNVFQDG